MQRYPVRKFLGLIALYAVLIVGILVLQFKTESVFTKSSGSLRISMAQTQGTENEMKLKNQFQVTFPGLMMSVDESNPAVSYNSQAQDDVHNLVLESYKENYGGNDGAIQLNFTDGSYIVFQVSQSKINDRDSESLLIAAFPANGQDDVISLPYKIMSTHTIEEYASTRMILNSGNTLFALSAPYIGEDRLGFVASNNIATYSEYNPASKFEFVAVSGMPLTDSTLCNTNVKHFRDTLVTRFLHPSADESEYTESEVIAYVAEMASRGSFDDGINHVPDSFQRGSRRTYLSVPYFGKLAALDGTLDVEVERLSSMVQNAVAQKNMNVFTVDSVIDYILREKKKDTVSRLLSFPVELYGESAEKFHPTVAQASGLISVYTKLLQNDSEKASILAPVMEPCMEILASYCSIVDGRLVVSENDSEIDSRQAIVMGQALLALGTKIQRSDYADAGRVLLNQSLDSPERFNLQTLAELYPVLVPENRYYPHCQVLGYYGDKAVWAWTCSPSVSYRIDGEGIVSINMEFPLNSSEYIYLKGVPNFHSKIEIQQLQYRSDPTFESYNSSGYVYNFDTQSLYLKSRHKARVELVRIWCDPVKNFTQN